MTQKVHLVLSYSLCIVFGLIIIGLVLVPNRKSRSSIDTISSKTHQIHKRANDESDSFTAFPGALYIRWRRLTCPDQANLVYDGTAAGGYYNHKGAPTNIQCLPRHPLWGKHNDVWAPTKGSRAYIYGVEYKTQANDFPFSHENAEALADHNLPCAVCMSKLRSTQLMIPGRAECVDGWHLEYSGYLMAGDYEQEGASQYVCVDKDPEADPAGYRKESSHHLITVESSCGSVPCPPYVAGRELPCSICTK